jgi:hypothetical protein
MGDERDVIVAYEAFNPETDEAPTGSDADCDGVDPDEDDE